MLHLANLLAFLLHLSLWRDTLPLLSCQRWADLLLKQIVWKGSECPHSKRELLQHVSSKCSWPSFHVLIISPRLPNSNWAKTSQQLARFANLFNQFFIKAWTWRLVLGQLVTVEQRGIPWHLLSRRPLARTCAYRQRGTFESKPLLRVSKCERLWKECSLAKSKVEWWNQMRMWSSNLQIQSKNDAVSAPAQKQEDL